MPGGRCQMARSLDRINLTEIEFPDNLIMVILRAGGGLQFNLETLEFSRTHLSQTAGPPGNLLQACPSFSYYQSNQYAIPDIRRACSRTAHEK